MQLVFTKSMQTNGDKHVKKHITISKSNNQQRFFKLKKSGKIF